VHENPKLSAVTGLYDLGRGHLDGRSIDIYLAWLNATLRVPLPFTIFLDPSIDPGKLNLKPGDKVVQVPLSDFRPFTWRDRVKLICESGKGIRARRDLSFLMPDYSLLTFCKFEMVRRAATDKPADHGLIWIDAGLSRFFDRDLAEARVDQDFRDQLIGNATFAASITPALAKDLQKGHLSKRYAGTCQRLVTGGDFYVGASSAQAFEKRIMEFIETEWLANGVWDNEQVALGYVLMQGVPGAKIVNVSLDYANILDRLLGYPPRKVMPKRTLAQPLARLFGMT
jgi:hypothetical protein